MFEEFEPLNVGQALVAPLGHKWKTGNVLTVKYADDWYHHFSLEFSENYTIDDVLNEIESMENKLALSKI